MADFFDNVRSPRIELDEILASFPLHELPLGRSRLLVLIYRHGLGIHEAAEALGISKNAAYQRLRRARAARDRYVRDQRRRDLRDARDLMHEQ